MDIKFNCISCGQHFVIDETYAGQSVECPKCGHSITVSKQDRQAPPVNVGLADWRETSVDPPEVSWRAPSPLSPFSRPLTIAIADVLTVVAVLQLFGAVVAGIVIGSENLSLGLIYFGAGIIGGIFTLGFAAVLKYLQKATHHLENIESNLSKTTK